MNIPINSDVIRVPARQSSFLGLTGGISIVSAVSVLAISFLANVSFSAIAQLNPYVLQVQLGLNPHVQGSVTGLLTSVQELVAILTSGVAGLYADRFGRRVLLTVGGAALSAGFIAIMLAGSLADLVAGRVVFALGMTATMTTLLIFNGDYPTETSRGRWIGLVGFLQAGGSFTAAMTVTSLPAFFQVHTGVDAHLAGLMTFTSCTILGLAILSLALWGIRLQDDFKSRGQHLSILQRLAGGIKEARNPRIALGYLASIASKADLVAINGFLFLWTVRFAGDHHMSVAQGYGTGRRIMAVTQLGFIFTAPVIGLLLDRMNRTLGMLICFAAASVAFLTMGAVDDPTGHWVVARGLALGISEAAAMVSAFALIAQQTRPVNRGIIMGMFGTCGALGMLLGAAGAGYLFDHWRYSAPYLLMGGINVGVTLATLCVLVIDRQRT